ncbi:MAG: hypothetical protein RI894_164 [Bacteroidota bacterium]|jgi:hypothetical protein
MRLQHSQFILFLLTLAFYCTGAASVSAKPLLYSSNPAAAPSCSIFIDTPKGGSKRVYAEFSIINDTNADYQYFMGGSVETIKKGNTRTFSCPEGIEIYHLENDGKGKLWFTVSPVFNKQVFKLSEITKSDLFAPKG